MGKMKHASICKACGKGTLYPDMVDDKVIGYACGVCYAEHTLKGRLA